MNPIPRRLAAIGCAAIMLFPFGAEAEPANTLKELWAELGACALAQGVDADAELTISFMLNRRGDVIGKPHITYAKLPADADARQRIIGDVARAMNICLPLPITDGLGGAIAGRLLAIRLAGPKRGSNI